MIFWVIKILTTGMGEAASDYFGQTSRVLGAIVGASGLAVAMWLQLRSRYRAQKYWFAVAMVAVFGTMAADAGHIVLGLSYYVTSAFYGLVLAACSCCGTGLRGPCRSTASPRPDASGSTGARCWPLLPWARQSVI